MPILSLKSILGPTKNNPLRLSENFKSKNVVLGGIPSPQHSHWAKTVEIYKTCKEWPFYSMSRHKNSR